MRCVAGGAYTPMHDPQLQLARPAWWPAVGAYVAAGGVLGLAVARARRRAH